MTKPKRFKSGKHLYIKWDEKVKEVRKLTQEKILEIKTDDNLQEKYFNDYKISFDENNFQIVFLFKKEKSIIKEIINMPPQSVKKLVKDITASF